MSDNTSLTDVLHIQTPTPEQRVSINWPGSENIQLTVKRDDLIHPIISGNKWRKLKHALYLAQQQNVSQIVSFGGGFSNHLHALGYCCHQLNIDFTAIVRGDYSKSPSPMLQDLALWQTNIQYVNKITYQQRTNPDYLHAVQQQSPQALIIPEGGSQQQALLGVANIIQELNSTYDYVIAPVASGATLAGLIQGNGDDTSAAKQIIGIGVLKGKDYLTGLVNNLLPTECSTTSWKINHDYHFGGYAKSSPELKQFCLDFYQQTAIPIEPVYSGKLFYAVRDLIAKQYFEKGSRILALHTGGLQGDR